MAAGDRLPLGIEGFPGREHNDLVLWIESRSAVVVGDSLADFDDGIAIQPEWLREGVTREQVSKGCGRSSAGLSTSCSPLTESRQIALRSNARSLTAEFS